jgi:hypothetical protein
MAGVAYSAAVFLLCAAPVTAEQPWVEFDVADMHLGYPGIVSGSALKFALGLPPPLGFGIGTSLVNLGGTNDAAPQFLGMFPLDIYYVPVIHRNNEGKPMPAVYSYVSFNSWLASCGPNLEPGAYVKSGVGIEWEFWEGGSFGYFPTYDVSPCASCATAAVMLLPGTIGFELGIVADRCSDGTPLQASVYADLKLSFGWHWRQVGRRNSEVPAEEPAEPRPSRPEEPWGPHG